MLFCGVNSFLFLRSCKGVSKTSCRVTCSSCVEQCGRFGVECSSESRHLPNSVKQDNTQNMVTKDAQTGKRQQHALKS